jgi:hypothetical protein
MCPSGPYRLRPVLAVAVPVASRGDAPHVTTARNGRNGQNGQNVRNGRAGRPGDIAETREAAKITATARSAGS